MRTISKSIEYIEKLAGEKRFGENFPQNWGAATPVPFFDILFKTYPSLEPAQKDNRISYSLSTGDGCKRNVSITYDPSAQFQWVTSKTNYSDGTLLFWLELYKEVANRVVCGTTYYKPTAPDDFEASQQDYDLEYVVGDFCGLTEHGDFGIENKPWMRSKNTVALPVSVQYVKHNQSKNL